MMYEVEKFGRGSDGKWFGFGAKRFPDLGAAEAYFVEFAAAQHEVLNNGLRIDLRIRKGRALLAVVGGRMTDATTIRWQSS